LRDGGCRYCGKAIDSSSRKCPHCGATLGKRDANRPVLTEGGTANFVPKATREARLFLTGMGTVLLVLWVSATMTGVEFFQEQGDDRSLFYLVVVNRAWLLGGGAGLLGAGALFWTTEKMAFAYLGALAWFAVAWSPIACLATAPDGGRRSRAPVVVRPMAVPRLIGGVAAWLVIATLPLYRFRDLARARERLNEGDSASQ
jgi:hypothetical protein